MKHFSFVSALCFLIFLSFNTQGQDKEADRIDAASSVLQEFSNMKEDIPAELFRITEGIIIVPKMINAGFVLAGKRGRGIAMIKSEDGSWSNPVFVTITGGSVGFQAGIQSVDLVLAFKSAHTLHEIGNGSFTLGGDISVAAGPVGRSSSASTDYKMEAEVYSYSKSKGLFAGISLSGSAISIDAKANENFYGAPDDAQALFASPEHNAPPVLKVKSILQQMFQ